MNGDVLLADRLNDEDLPPEHGALLRLVSPSQYGYKSTKHLCRIHLHTAAPKSKLGRREHPRARVSLEERHPTLPPWRVRWLYRLAVPIVSYTQYLGHPPSSITKEQEIVKSNPSAPLTLAALLSIAVAALHLAIIPFGAEGLRYLAAPQRLVEMAERGDHLVPTVAVVSIFVVFSTFALYAWSGAGRMRKLPGLGFVLLVITSIYILRGVVVVPQIPISLLDPDALPPPPPRPGSVLRHLASDRPSSSPRDCGDTGTGSAFHEKGLARSLRPVVDAYHQVTVANIGCLEAESERRKHNDGGN